MPRTWKALLYRQDKCEKEVGVASHHAHASLFLTLPPIILSSSSWEIPVSKSWVGTLTMPV